jgi:NADP-dependent 3-hydroxy acid dehydrogenase YdfG
VPTIRADVTHAESLRSSVTVAAELLGDLDVFARNGGSRARGPVEEARPPRTKDWNALRCRS